ncbi:MULTISPECIES: anthranilate phosphoribosyltransferase [Prochlorococcus]|uniref:Anthranilate phosphoribosyltransferase n=1 Tax=Prochlorococcus marinus (strain SARG / CCMP1375 / SS120) TaxID=167539 RepID=TRPD_PROMA|nr:MULTISPECIES: anthranilate phosphoribosyltransferase [Prochlorococcus]Q7VCJ6.1 RecName: Full=Anthranilate phosphoribosyltransferase [Prochlorococcus marinus subsp. marinus str. CCMP1375]AAP99788.1 Anthranilate phosphoribosyltransferase [Prochlorococcus marinus subsp. marinus str. CCMP1375]KGG11867.1 Anthranilate phosphoribosyltransferase [Prochlorococcus marinus str. LG]KGG21826.1 Anthranilate phosphoribosyltransferase [Prochlorococcus marinus str. SS2]KGG23743.1 Anthranilate phosphoribosyl
MPIVSWPELLEKLLSTKEISEIEAKALMKAWLNDELLPVQTGAFLTALRAKQISGLELSSMAEVLRDACLFPYPLPEVFMVDTCGTGGDGADTFNISTAVAFVTASCGVTIAKHGNRSASGKVGSADVLEGLGIKLNAPLELVVKAIEKNNITFLFAPAWHSSLINLAPLRKALGVRTVFNLLGPLVNPFRPKAQVLGVAKSELLDPMVEALRNLGLERAVVVHGAGGLDEASLEGPNEVRFLENGQITSKTLDVEELGLTISPNSTLKGGSLATNQDILRSLFQGRGTQSQREVVALNSSLVFWASGKELDLKKGVTIALEAMELSKPLDKFNELKCCLE